MFYFQNAVLNENKGFTIYLQCLCPLGFKIHADFLRCSEQCYRENCLLVQFLNISKVKLKEPHSPTFGCIPTLTLSSGTYQTHMSQSRSSAAKFLTQKGFFFSPVGSAVSCSGSIACACENEGTGEYNWAWRVQEERFFFKWFDSSRSGVRTIITNQEKTQEGFWCNSEDKVCASDGRNPWGTTASARDHPCFIRCSVKTTTITPLTSWNHL